MDAYRLHLKIGAHEFSAEGPVEVVKQDFELWKSLIQALPAQPASTPTDVDKKPVVGAALTREQIDRVCLADSKRDLVWLRILPRSSDRYADALLLIILGYRMIRGADEVMVTRLRSAMRQSGCMVDRVDQVARKYLRQGLLNKGGMGKGGRYSLTNSGMDKAAAILADLTSS